MTASVRPKAFAPELDVLRGVAAVLMVVNHAGFRLLSPADSTSSISGAVVFIGGFAPVVFFFATGFGIALSSAARNGKRDMGSVLWKAALLVLADQFFYWRAGHAWGIDFFSFIAICSVVVTLVARLPRPALACLVLSGLVLGLRYVAGPLLRGPTLGMPVVQWIVGANVVPNASYPLSPWIVYPLLGFALGRLYGAVDMASPRVRGLSVALGSGLAAVALGASLVLATFFHSAFFRWGMVSSAYFVLSLGVLSLAIVLASQLTSRLPRVADALALRGVASFAVIPIHYALLDLCAIVLPLPVEPWAYALLAALILVAAFVAAAGFARWVAADSVSRQRSLVFPGLLLALVVLGWATLRGSGHDLATIALLVLAGQLTVAGLLGLRGPTPPRALPA